MRFALLFICSCSWAATDISGLLTISNWNFEASGVQAGLPADPGDLNYTVNDLGNGLWSVWATYDAHLSLISNRNKQELNVDFRYTVLPDLGYYLASSVGLLVDTTQDGTAADLSITESVGSCVTHGDACLISDTTSPLPITTQISMTTWPDHRLWKDSVSVEEITDTFYIRQKPGAVPEPSPNWLAASGLVLIVVPAVLRRRARLRRFGE